MATEREMTLMLRIRARGNEALKEFHKLDAAFRAWQKRTGETWSGIGRAVMLPFRMIGTLGGILLAPLKFALEAGAALTAGLTALGAAAIHAAAGDERLIERLTQVAGSADRARRAFKEIEAISSRGPFKTEDLAEATIIMSQFGMASRRTLGALANASRVAGMSVEDMARMVGALQLRGLRPFGISMEERGGSFDITYRDRMNKVRQITAATADEARRKLVDILAFKFGTELRPRGLSEFITMLRNNIDQAFANVGEPMLAAATRFVNFLSEKLRGLIESGRMEEIGKKAGEWLTKAVNSVMAFFDTLPTVFAALKEMWEKGPEKLASILRDVMVASGNVLGVAIVEYLSAASSIFRGLGKAISGAFMEEILQLPIPGMAGKRRGMYLEAVGKLSEEGLRDEVIRAGLARPNEVGKYGPRMLRSLLSSAIRDPAEEARLAAEGVAGPAIAEGMRQAASAIPNAVANVAATARAEFAKVNASVAGATGINLASEYRKNLSERQSEAAAWGKERVTARFRTRVQDAPGRYHYEDVDRSVMAPIGTYRVGQRVGRGGTVINIENLQVYSSDPRNVQDSITRAASRGAASG
jgi:hypothetical protein